MKKLDQTKENKLSRDDMLREQIREGHVRDAEAVKSGKLRQEDLYFASPEIMKQMTVHFTAAALEDFEL
jgi:hypothetical protein